MRIDREPQLVNGLYRVDLKGKTLNALEKGGLPIYCYGIRAESTKSEKGLSGTIAVYQEGILFYSEPWHIQLEMIEEENARLQKIDPSWRVIAPPNAATAIEVAQAVEKQHGFNVLPFYTRVGNGSLFAGNFNPRHGADVRDNWYPFDRSSRVGVLPLAVKV